MRRGGRYLVEKDGGKPGRVECTKPDPRGDRARDASGKALSGRKEGHIPTEAARPEPAARSAKPAKTGKEG